MKVLHRGSFSTVYLANGKVVKAYHKQLLQPRHRLNIFREVAILRKLNKLGVPGLVRLHHTCEDAGSVYLVFEACLGDLYRHVAANGLLSEDKLAAQVVVPLLQVLHRLHQLGILHRDIKPENLFFAQGGGLVLGDFGLAVEMQERPVSRVGTLEFMAPEILGQPSADAVAMRRLRGQPVPRCATYDTKVDIWAVGVLVQEVLTGHTPFGHTMAEVVSLKAQFKEPADLGPGVSRLCKDFVRLALTKASAERPSALELLAHPWLQAHISPADTESLGLGTRVKSGCSLPASPPAALSSLQQLPLPRASQQSSHDRQQGDERHHQAPAISAPVQHMLLPVPVRHIAVRAMPVAVCCSWTPAPQGTVSCAYTLCRAGSEPQNILHTPQRQAAVPGFRSPVQQHSAVMAAAAATAAAVDDNESSPGAAPAAASGGRGCQVLLQQAAAANRPQPLLLPGIQDACSAAVPLYVAAGQLQAPAVVLLSPGSASNWPCTLTSDSSASPLPSATCSPFMVPAEHPGGGKDPAQPAAVKGIPCPNSKTSSHSNSAGNRSLDLAPTAGCTINPLSSLGLLSTTMLQPAAVLVAKSVVRRGLWGEVSSPVGCSSRPLPFIFPAPGCTLWAAYPEMYAAAACDCR